MRLYPTKRFVQILPLHLLIIASISSFSACGSGQPSLPTSEERTDESFESVQLLSQPAILAPGATQSIGIPGGWRHVRGLTIEAAGISRDAMFEVLTNDTVKGTIYVPGSDPNYVVTVAEGTRSIELHHLQGGQVRITRIVAVVSHYSSDIDIGDGGIGSLCKESLIIPAGQAKARVYQLAENSCLQN